MTNYHEEESEMSAADMLTMVCAWVGITKGSVKVTKFIGLEAIEVLATGTGNKFKISVEKVR